MASKLASPTRDQRSLLAWLIACRASQRRVDMQRADKKRERRGRLS